MNNETTKKISIKDILGASAPKVEVPNKISYVERRFEESKSNKNNMSYWLPKVINCGINIPETTIMQLSLEQFEWFGSDDYSKEAIASMSDYIQNYLKEIGFNTERELFIKTGNFSDKFSFNHCKVTDLNEIGEQFLSVYYSAMMVGAGNSTELVVREFIKNNVEKTTIYNGMPLNTEFRAFYNFDTNELLGVFNYWDTTVVSDSLLKSCKYSKEALVDYVKFRSIHESIEKEFDSLKEKVANIIAEKMKSVELEGVWSVDLMYANDDFYLIDMALAHQSYYFEKVKDLIK